MMLLVRTMFKGNIYPRSLTHNTGKRYPESVKSRARKELWHRAEIPVTMPVRSREPMIPRHVIYRKKPRTLSGQ